MDGYKFIPSPNFRRGRKRDIDMIVIHYTASGSLDSAVRWFSTKTYEDADGRERRNYASSHYIIDKDGSVVQMVREEDKAWHAGLSIWDGEKYCNSRSIGIELVNWGPLKFKEGAYRAWPNDYGKKAGVQNPYIDKDGEPRDPFPSAQIIACAELCFELQQRYPKIIRDRIVGHEAISGPDIRDDPKQDPGEAFSWSLFDGYLNAHPGTSRTDPRDKPRDPDGEPLHRDVGVIHGDRSDGVELDAEDQLEEEFAITIAPVHDEPMNFWQWLMSLLDKLT